MKLGIAVPAFASAGVASFRTPEVLRLDWKDASALVCEAEELGFHSAWVCDHVFMGHDGETFECWTALSALAGMTDRIRLGTIHLGNLLRDPALVAKMAATFDHVSGGRLELFLEPGWREREHVAYGIAWLPVREDRVQRLRETVDVLLRLWTGEEVSYDGEHVKLDAAICRPVPVQPGGPPIMLGEALDEASIDLIVDTAAAWNSMPAPVRVVAEKVAAIDAACHRRQRDPGTLRKTLETQVLLVSDEAELEQHVAHWAELRAAHPSGSAMSDVFTFLEQTNPQFQRDPSLEDLRDEFLIGTPEQVVDKLNAYGELGIDEVICWLMDVPERRSLHLLAEEVMPYV